MSAAMRATSRGRVAEADELFMRVRGMRIGAPRAVTLRSFYDNLYHVCPLPTCKDDDTRACSMRHAQHCRRDAPHRRRYGACAYRRAVVAKHMRAQICRYRDTLRHADADYACAADALIRGICFSIKSHDARYALAGRACRYDS